MKTYTIVANASETIEFKVLEDGYVETYALVHKSTSSPWEVKTIIMNQREVLKLYEAIQEEVLKAVK